MDHTTHFERQLIGIVSHDLRNPLSAITLTGAPLALTIVRNIVLSHVGTAGRAAHTHSLA